mmetsp:Transcript_42794/g.72859  ORF Transcript_42794/g.72859 Transcript_42794/m.72859 type:complete len:208 (-) Transcript_42794:1392-2015(-)
MTRPVSWHSDSLRNMVRAKRRGNNRKAEEAASPKLMVQHTAHEFRRDNANIVPIQSETVLTRVGTNKGTRPCAHAISNSIVPEVPISYSVRAPLFIERFEVIVHVMPRQRPRRVIRRPAFSGVALFFAAQRFGLFATATPPVLRVLRISQAAAVVVSGFPVIKTHLALLLPALFVAILAIAVPVVELVEANGGVPVVLCALVCHHTN